MKSINVFLLHILDAIEKIERYTEGYDYEHFDSDDRTHEAVIRQLEIIAEATTHLEEKFKTDYPQIPWQDIKGMRNHLIHEYWSVNLKDVWQTVIEEIPTLKKMLAPILKEIQK